MNGVLIWTAVAMTMICGLVALGENSSLHWELKLYTDLMQAYNKNIKPVRRPHQQLTAHLIFSLARVESLDEKDQILTTFGWMIVSWMDEILQWDPAEYGGLLRMTVAGNQVWIPEIAMLNSVDEGSDLTLTDHFRVTIFANGEAKWVPGFKWKTSCKVNLLYFPFDAQVCEVQFINWMYQSEEVNLTNDASTVELSKYITHGEWDLTSTSVGRTDMVYEDGTNSFTLPVVAFQLKLKRKPIFLVVNTVVPAVIMTVISLLVFCLPADAGEKISLGITVLLSYSVILLRLSDITPRASANVPILTAYIIFSMGISALALCCTVSVLCVHHHLPEKPLPSCLRTTILRGLASLLCMRRRRDGHRLVEGNAIYGNKVMSLATPPESRADNAHGLGAGDTSPINNDQLAILSMLHSGHKEKQMEDKNANDWKAVARVIDRFCLVMFCVAMAIATGAMMGVMANNSDEGFVDGAIYFVS